MKVEIKETVSGDAADQAEKVLAPADADVTLADTTRPRPCCAGSCADVDRPHSAVPAPGNGDRNPVSIEELRLSE
jgi:hypothetical protein